MVVFCLVVFKSGKYLVFGEKIYMGFKVDVIVWDFEKGIIKYILDLLYKVKVEVFVFFLNDKYFVFFGG